MISLPLNETWTQPNDSDKYGSLAYTKNITLDKKGMISLSPRMVNLFDDSGSVTNVASTNFNIMSAFGRYGIGSMYLATLEEPFNLAMSNTAKTIAEDVSSNNPNLAFGTSGVWYQNRWHVSTDQTVAYSTAGTWTANAITGLTTGKRHPLATFKNKNTICVGNGNVVKQYDTSYAGTTDLTLPTDYEIIGLAYNNYKLGIITRLGTDSAGQNSNAYFFEWDGGTSSAGTGVDIGAYTAVGIYPYKSSFVIVTSAGQLLYWNGGGFDELAHFPFYISGQEWGDLTNALSYGNNIVVEGDLIYINIAFNFSTFGKKGEQFFHNNHSGVWCYDPDNGLYHRYSLSNTKTYLHTISDANVNTSTDTFTTSSTIPATGSPMFVTSLIGGLKRGVVYYVIKLSSTTFKVAETRDKAMAGDAMDITSVASLNYLWLFDEIDFGTGYAVTYGAIGLWGSSSLVFEDVIVGGRVLNTSLSAQPTLCSVMPNLEARGYFVTPRLFLGSVEENIQKLYIKHKTLDKNDAIIVKVKTKEYLGIPVSSPNYASTPHIVWTGTNQGYTTSDLSEIKTAHDAGEEIEVEFTAGAGAGQLVKLWRIDESSGTYTLTFSEDVRGVTMGLFSHFVMDNWRIIGSVDATTQKQGVFEVPLGEYGTGKAPQFKIELRGYKTTIEDFKIINTAHIPSK